LRHQESTPPTTDNTERVIMTDAKSIPSTVQPQVEVVPGKWRALLLLSLAELLAMAVWFSASAVVPTLTDAWQLSGSGQSWLTMSVQIGFVVGAFGSAVLALADRVPAGRLFAISAILAGLVTALIPLVANGLGTALMLRFLTGLFLAGVYPVGMKLMTTWTQVDRGLGIGMLVGALTVGSASPHLLKFFGDIDAWQPVLYLAAGSALAGGIIALLFITEGPFRTKSPRFDWRQVGNILREREVMLANLGYLGHQWELYAMWTWISAFLLASFEINGIEAKWASLLAFGAIGIGGLGSLLAGKLADQFGRTTVASASLAVSGTCTVLVGRLFGGDPALLALVVLVWGFAIVADSAQFSACVSELCDPRYTGTALTLQTSMGFLLTLFTIRMMPVLRDAVGWQWAFAFLAIGPVVGLWAMWTLRRSPARAKLAGGRG
jgi:MFS family permease